MDPRAKEWSLFNRHFKAADKDLRRMDTTGTAGFHGSAHSVQTKSTLITTTQDALASSELALARALSQVSLSSGSTAASAANISAITPASSDARLLDYCWTHGHTTNSSHTSATCNHCGDGHQATATAAHSMGGNIDNFIPQFQRREQRPGGTAAHADQANNITTISQLYSSKISSPSPPIIIDYGATGHFFRISSNLLGIKPTTNGIAVSLSDGAHIRSTHTGTLPVPDLPLSACRAHVFHPCNPIPSCPLGNYAITAAKPYSHTTASQSLVTTSFC
jgi:hypothetical protein